MPTNTPSDRGEQTRQALLESAIEIFGRDGFHAASNRTIASHAGVNQALIGYHFGSKQGLYLAVFEYIAAQVAQTMQPVLSQVDNTLTDLKGEPEANRDTYINCMELILFGFAGMVTQEKTGWARLVLKEQQDPTEAFQLLFTSIISRILETLSKLAALSLGKAETDPAIGISALSLIGQVLVFRAANAAALRHMRWSGVGEKELALIQTHIRKSLLALFAEDHTL